MLCQIVSLSLRQLSPLNIGMHLSLNSSHRRMLVGRQYLTYLIIIVTRKEAKLVVIIIIKV